MHSELAFSDRITSTGSMARRLCVGVISRMAPHTIKLLETEMVHPPFLSFPYDPPIQGHLQKFLAKESCHKIAAACDSSNPVCHMANAPLLHLAFPWLSFTCGCL